ncbi:DUF4258 domain-containing protein [Massilia cavernae]|uniref:DUF4258 domain-containing protein n=1 Tax=Massilia cavernae TaxID=2320864 RepID=A0A418XSW9_9BURK|nr:DUF4258 domain-containing protein [Massilia cavernae]
MTTKQARKRTQLSKQQLEAYIRAESLDSQNVFFTNHVKQQMRKRHISVACVISTLREGRIKRTPEPNTMLGTLECRMEHYCTGHNVGVVVAISDDVPDLVLVTAMYI